MNKTCFVTVNYNSYDILSAFINDHSIFFSPKKPLFVADLSSQKKNISQNNNVYFFQSENRGYAYGVNICLKEAIKRGFNQFVVINNDVRLREDFVFQSEKAFNSFPESIIGAKIYYERGYEYHKNRYKKKDLGKVLWYAGGNINWKHALVFHRGVDEIDQGQFDKQELTDFVTGCCMLFSKSVVQKVGLWDEKFFMYYEDTDYCVRAKKRGIKIIYNPKLVMWHQNAQSTGGSGSHFHVYCQQRSRLRFGLKHAPIKTKIHLIIHYLKKQLPA